MNILTCFNFPKHVDQLIDIIEIRVDSVPNFFLDFKKYQNAFNRPVLLTYRTDNIDETYANMINKLAKLNPDYLDVQYGLDPQIVEAIKQKHPKIKLILSYHNFGKTPYDLNKIYRAMQLACVNYYKIVTMAHSSLDALRVLCFLKQNRDGRLAAFCMGEIGQFSRILSKKWQSALHFMSETSSNALSQLSLEQLKEYYSFFNINGNTQIFTLLGDPVSYSISHYCHTKILRAFGINAVYVKILLKPNEVEQGVKYFYKLGFKGASITMPLKACFTKYCNQLDPTSLHLGIFNTIDFAKKIGINTDAIACLELIKQYLTLKNKTVVLIGAGSVASVFAHVLSNQGAKIICFNRTFSKAKKLIDEVNGHAYSLDDLPSSINYDVMINTTSIGMNDHFYPLPDRFFRKDKVYFDVVLNHDETAFLSLAKKKSNKIISGFDLFKVQATYQFAHWLNVFS